MKSKIILFIIVSIIHSEILFQGVFGDDLKSLIINNYTPNTTLGYNQARDVMYANVDRINGSVKGIYTNYSVNLPNGVDASTHLYNNGMNCEHTWPQSFGAISEPQKSDMHHLRPCKSNVNSARGNMPFGESNDNQTYKWYWQNVESTNIPNSQIDQYSERNTTAQIFEPREDVKGDIARGMFYFYTLYSDEEIVIESGGDSFFSIQKNILLDWNNYDPPDDFEITRSNLIANIQGNLNPFVIDPTLVSRIYFWNQILAGDLNVDNSLNIIDIVLMVDLIFSQTAPTYEQLYIIDSNNDNDFNISDIVLFVQTIVEEV
ncbi:MAG: hypothetical protein CMG00_07245 [Candidatus Marinimicrobia bacterium]|nr:hypothetical protein [Candidatus Neomarinimicrobiota bacterium]|tara:strand:+ start:15582 stop:16535 length:954 start_codon:yes stop_codon:yes gene_type:complete